VRTADPDNRTCFHWAMRSPNIHCLKWLCKYGSVPEAVNQLVSSSGCTVKDLSWVALNQ